MRFPPSLRPAIPIAMSLAVVGVHAWAADSRRVNIPLKCSRGPDGQVHNVIVTVPAGAPPGSRYTVRIDGVDSGKISHVGLHYIFDMQSQWPIPAGTEYIEGSARVVPDTGSPGVRKGARVVYGSGMVTLVLPAHVDNGSSYTPPSFEFGLTVTASAGATITQSFYRYRVMANAFLVGDVDTSCDPTPKPFAVARTMVEPGS
jgi:hypothetical protein